MPRFRGQDEQGERYSPSLLEMFQLTWAISPMTSCAALSGLLRQFHDATADFPQLPLGDRGDLSQRLGAYELRFRQRDAQALIDFDTLAPA